MQKRFFPSARPVRRKSRVQRSGLLSLRRVRRLAFLRRRPERDTKASFVMTRLPGPPFRYWVPVSPPEGLDRRRRRYWPLVGLPRWVSGTGQKTVLWVPCLTEKRSRAELADFEAEPERAMRRLPVLPEHPCSALSALLLVPVILLHLMRNGWRTLPGAFTALFPQTPSGWVDRNGYSPHADLSRMAPRGYGTLPACGRAASDRQLRFRGSLPLVPLTRGRSGLGHAGHCARGHARLLRGSPSADRACREYRLLNSPFRG